MVAHASTCFNQWMCTVNSRQGCLVAGEGDEGRSLRLCYLRHAFGLGEHYNSVTSLPDEEEDD